MKRCVTGKVLIFASTEPSPQSTVKLFGATESGRVTFGPRTVEVSQVVIKGELAATNKKKGGSEKRKQQDRWN